ncbi:DUF4396 domain-containing protein [Nocardioides scoriae]|uniref:DUF4396 domain-containing protein n=1 Tax=Nocardioides scoriae TaxID=642780 RepID=UPI0012F8F040|nr:DUF4396 domain-containing protein [Nocardioides scoriae]
MPAWVTPVAWVWIVLCVATAVAVAVDVHRGRRHPTVATELVWIASGLYLGPFTLPLYRRQGRAERAGAPRRAAPGTASAAVAGLPGGAASAVAHLVGVPLVLVSGLTIAGIDLWVMIIVIGVLAMLLLVAYERTASRADSSPSGSTPHRSSLASAAVAAVVTVLAFDVGMGGWMLLLHFNEYMPPASEGSFWFLMQAGIVLGLVTGWPAVRWLQRERRAVAPSV